MRIERLGESTLILRDLGEVPAHFWADRIRKLEREGVEDVVASYETVGVYFDPNVFDPAKAGFDRISIEEGAQEGSQTHRIPVCYELGEDLESVANGLGLSVEEVVALHTGARFRCFAVGFCPGFPYLGYLPDELSGVPRLDRPRTKTSPGSVGITGRQTGIYPLETPGGWPIIGRTPLEIVNVKDSYFPISPGDEIVFEPISFDEFESRKGTRL